MPDARLQRCRDAYDRYDVEVYLAQRRLPTMANYPSMTIEDGMQRIQEWVDLCAARDVYGRLAEWYHDPDMKML
jgi:hypothetical protein